MKKSPAFIKLCKEHGVDYKLIPEITGFEDACKDQNLDPVKCLPDVSGMPEDLQVFTTNLTKVAITLKSLNKKDDGTYWVPNYNDSSERKWYAWWDMEVSDYNPSGFRFVSTLYAWTTTYSVIGARLVSRNSDIARFAALVLIELYRGIMK